MLSNTPETWGSLAKSFHWLIVVLVVLEAPVGYLMSYTYGLSYRDKGAALPLHNLFSQIHHTNGFLILLLVTGRLAWRLHGGRPSPSADRIGVQHRLAGLTHALLYVLLFLLPLSGWAALSVYGVAPIWLFDRKGVMPPVLPVLPLKSPFGYGFFAHVHIYALYTGAALVGLHVVAALWRHFVVRDDVLVRMCRSASGRPGKGLEIGEPLALHWGSPRASSEPADSVRDSQAAASQIQSVRW